MSAQRTPLYAQAQALNARMTDFAGWEMPVQYSGIKQEHQAVRQSAGMFDISHMGKFLIEGPAAIAALQKLVPTDLSRLKPGQAQYTVLLNPQGGIIDDLIFYLKSSASDGHQVVAAIVNAATKAKDWDWMQSALAADDLTLHDLSAEHGLMAVQGPDAAAQLQPLVDADLSQVKRFGHIDALLCGHPAFLARTGYTGEDGFEVMVPAEAAAAVWTALLKQGVVPCGLGARDTLRLEAAMALYGQDITDDTTPLEAGLGWLVHCDRKDNFIGRSVLVDQQENGLSRKLVGLRMEGRNIARHDYPVLHEGKSVGTVTSGTLSPTLEYPIALAYVPPDLAKVGQSLEVEIRGKACPAKVVKRPFYRAG
ncbi:glycine cleavage system protein T [filamentous cyanobacterium CCP5]|nr:glycine cleavage system protein T [filamentous cyanobacterium CCP5]